ncbi:AraC family transcriptional regulator [Rhodobacteraceae bacterium N5(2021)]|uniref:AraC family transcriptional regulator n=1 Tax=Gymnodinialimonas phycosphaerae TaxID=2841589 RepID=A0A975TWE0_9RHOB|nr:AraC family transcriptional regulator [Gymnodinialimonas phycosphaerae]
MFKIDTYIAPDEAFHFARKTLPDTPPVLEHTHDYFELFLVEHGQLHHWINGLEERLEIGQLVFVRPGDRHALQSAPGTGGRILNVMFRKATARHLGDRYRDETEGRFFWSWSEFPHSLRLAGPQLERAVNAMLTLQTSHRSLAKIEHFLLAMITHVLDATASAEDRAPSWLVRAAHAARDPRVFRQGSDGFIEVAGRSQEHVCRATRRHLGLSPTQYINRIRMQHAAMLLAGTGRPVSEVAEEVGLENLSYFHKLFRLQYGTTPRSYRERHTRRATLIDR